RRDCIYEQIQVMQPATHLSIESMCGLGQVSRAGFYRHWQQQEPGVEETELRAQVQQIALAHRRNYGYRRVTQELRQQGWAVNRKRVARIMAADNLLCVRRRRFVLTTDSSHDLRVHLNLAARLQLSGIDQLWVADLTYIRLREQFVFLAVILDAFSRRVVGWALDESPCTAGGRRFTQSSLCATACSWPGPSFRPRYPVRLQTVRRLAAGAWLAAQHEPSRQSLRQCQVRKLHQNAQARRDLYARVSRSRRSRSAHHRVPGAVLQSPTSAFGLELPLPGTVRAELVERHEFGNRNDEFF